MGTRRTLLAAAALFGAAAIVTAASGQSAGATADPAGVERQIDIPANRETFVLAVTTGRLPVGSELVLETPDGRVLGSVVPFGGTAKDAGEQVHLVVVEGDGLPAGRIAIRARLVTGGTVRSASAQEFRGVRVVGE